METDKPFDALIIGSGIGGLSMGIILSLLNLRVAIIEKNFLPGGLMRSYQRGGMDCPVGIHYFGSFGEGESLRRMCDYLGVADGMKVERMGQDGPIDRYVFDDFSFDLPESLDTFEMSLEQVFPEERQSIATIMKNLHTLADVQNSFAFLSSSPPLLDMDLFAPLGTYLAKMNCSPRLRGILNGMTSGWMGMSESECPVLYHHLALVSYLLSSWRLRERGSALAEAFVSRFKDLGGTLVCGDPAAAILLAGNEIKGIKLASGRVLAASRIVAAIHPKTVLAMLPEGAVTPRHARRIMGLVDTEGLFAAHVVVDAATHPAQSHNVYRLSEDRDGALQDGVFYQLRHGRGDKNLLMIITKSLFSEWRQWEDTTTGRRGVAYNDEKERRADRLLKGAEGIFGPLVGAKVLDTYTPLTIRDWVNSPQGSPYGIMRSSHQLSAETLLHRQWVGGLYFAGQNALAPGVLGTLLGSFQTVRQMIGHDRFSREVFVNLSPGQQKRAC
jgi:all-trans-retinol 13,14-reductase